MVELTPVKDLEEYYEKLNFKVSISKMWNTLQTKAEYGTSRSEKGYQSIASLLAGGIASGIGANDDLAEILTMCQGAYFPAYGEEGKKAVLEYIKTHGINISEPDLARQFVEYELVESGNVIAPEFDELLKELFDDSKEATTPEVQIARLCGKTIKDVKLIEQMSSINQVDLLYNVSEDVKDASKKAGVPTPSPKLEQMLETIPEKDRKEKHMTDEEKKKIFARIDNFIEFTGKEKLDGVLRYIGTSEIER